MKTQSNFGITPTRTLFSSLIFLVLFPPGLSAQDVSGSGAAISSGVVYGAGIQTPLRFEGESAPKNQVSLAAGASVLYDDNALSSNLDREGQEALSFDAILGITRRSEHWTASFDYTPYFIWYSGISGFDRLNHAGTLNLNYRLTSRLTLGVQDSTTYSVGSYPALVAPPIQSGPPASPFQNDVIVPYTTRTLFNWSTMSLSFLKSRRTLITLSGGYDEYKYKQQQSAQPYYNNTGLNAGLAYQYQFNAHASIGFGLNHSDATFQGGEVFGNRVRFQVEGASATLTLRPTPSVHVTVFGGPEYVRSINPATQLASVVSNYQASGGANITKQIRSTAVDVSFARFVGVFGGLYTSTVDTTASFGVRQRLAKGWEADASGTVMQMDSSLLKSGNGKTNGLTLGFNITHSILHRATFHASYFRWDQVSRGTLPLTYSLDRDQVAVGIDLQVRTFPLGR